MEPAQHVEFRQHARLSTGRHGNASKKGHISSGQAATASQLDSTATESNAVDTTERTCSSPAECAQNNVDVFGNRHPPVAVDLIDCYHCGRSVAAGRFAPHLHKCMGKGRQASRQASRAWLSTLPGSGSERQATARSTAAVAGEECTGSRRRTPELSSLQVPPPS